MTYGLVMIVKDEAAGIAATLTAARPYLDAWTIIDTGSTDGTPDLIRASLYGVPGTLYARPWVNFGVNRSEAFALARGTADWLLALDADMAVTIDPTFRPDPSLDAYLIEMGNADFSWRLPLLLRGDLPWRSVGPVHEYTALPDRDYVRKPTDAVRIAMPGGDRSSPAKSRWHAELLEGADQDDPRTVFYLAQTYRELGDSRALPTYRRRAAMDGWPEETFVAAYEAAMLEPWPARAVSLMDVWERRPHRLEPLHALARDLNAHGLHHAAYGLLAGIKPTDPPTELFVRPSVWAWGIRFEQSIAAWWTGHVAQSRRLSGDLLADPRTPVYIRDAVERNLALTP